MDATLHALGGILLKALPTFFLILALHFYLKYTFFRPLERVLRQRYEASEGAQKSAEAALQKASEKAGEYETAVRSARAEIYRGQEQSHRQLEEERMAALREARERSEALVSAEKSRLEAEIEEAKRSLAAESEALADRIASVILSRSAA
jgi:F-type H+-transporting ATPase subunit b